jgi:ribosomal protein S18 acetylase RimI-like enzyme
MITIRSATNDDSLEILRIASGEPLFSPEENACVAELLQDYYQREDHNGYYFLTALIDDQVAGFACFGPTPLTRGTFDLYWLSVASAFKKQGIGRLLVQQVVQRISTLNARLLLADTSGRKEYAPTRAFYERQGFKRAAQIKNFYAPGDDLVMYTLKLK